MLKAGRREGHEAQPMGVETSGRLADGRGGGRSIGLCGRSSRFCRHARSLLAEVRLRAVAPAAGATARYRVEVAVSDSAGTALTSGGFDRTKFHHGGPFREAVLEGVLDPKRTIQIGIRDFRFDFFPYNLVTQPHSFFFDHLFGFGNNSNSFYDSTAQYEVKSADIFGLWCEKSSGDVEKTTIDGVDFFKKEKDKMSFLFDFGDDWWHQINVVGIEENNATTGKYPKVTKSVGASPPQYPR